MNLHLYFQPQIESIIDELIFKGYTENELQEPLKNIEYWWQYPSYEKVTLHYDSADMTIVGWLSAMEGLTGSCKDFNLDLLLQISTTIEARYAIKRMHEQEDYMATYKPELGATA